MANIKKSQHGAKLLADLNKKNIKELVLGRTFLQKHTQSLFGRGKVAADHSSSIAEADVQQPSKAIDVKNVK